jgi:short-subunit dehydrogenase
MKPGQYSAAKSACRIFLDTARIELKPFKIRVLTLCPGFIVTERNKQKHIPASLTMSMDDAARHILKALQKETREYLFPARLKAGITLHRLLPQSISNIILSRFLS